MIPAASTHVAPPPKLARPSASVMAQVPRAAHLDYCRAGLGAVLVFFPRLAASLVASRPLEHRPRRIIRLLGVRQLSQVLVTGDRPSVAVLFLGAEIDVAHAASMVTLALCSRRWRRAALIDAVIASLFALAGAAAGRSARPAAQAGSFAQTDRLARWLVPEHLVLDRRVPDRRARSAGPESPQGGARA